MLERLISAINSLSSQAWAFLLVIIGIISCVVFHKNGLSIDIVAGVIGAGVNMFTGLWKGSQAPGAQHIEMDTTPPQPPKES